MVAERELNRIQDNLAMFYNYFWTMIDANNCPLQQKDEHIACLGGGVGRGTGYWTHWGQWKREDVRDRGRGREKEE